MEITFIRHFQTLGNEKKQYIGATDEEVVPFLCLSEQNQKKRVSLISKRSKQCQGATQIISSPMKRCIQTAEMLFPKRALILKKEFRECHFGLFEGKSYEELKNHPQYQCWMEASGRIPFPEGEHPELFQRRCREGFRNMIRELQEKNCEKAVFVIHGGTIMSILSAMDEENRGFYHWQVENGGGYKVTLDCKAWEKTGKGCKEIEKL